MKPNDCIDFLKEDISFWEDIINNHALKETLKPYLIIESLNMALDTMQKYQKIQEIIKDWEDERFSDGVGCLRVRAVIEDGKID